MDSNELLDTGMTSGKIVLNEQMKADLKVTKTWTLVLAILGFIFSALMLISTLGGMVGVATAGSAGILGLLMMVLLLALYLFPSWCLWKYSQNLEAALISNNQVLLNTAFLYMRRYFKFIGILIVALFVLYLLIFIFGGLATIF